MNISRVYVISYVNLTISISLYKLVESLLYLVCDVREGNEALFPHPMKSLALTARWNN